jgi:hypothetical protein
LRFSEFSWELGSKEFQIQTKFKSLFENQKFWKFETKGFEFKKKIFNSKGDFKVSREL